MIIPLEDNEDVYTALFDQGRYGMPRYRRSPQMGGSFWERIIDFAKGLFSKAAPQISNLVSQAQPHVNRIATQALDSAVDSAVTNITEKLKKQSGGRKRKPLKRPALKGSKLK